MASYVDGFVIPVPKDKLADYQKLAKKASKVWKEHGALDYRECVGDDLEHDFSMPFPRGIRAKEGELIIFSFIVYKSRTHRDRVNAKVMKDPRIAAMCDSKNSPFDSKRMLYGGFKTIVEA